MKWLDNNKIIAWGFFFALGILAALNISSYWHMHRFMDNNKLMEESRPLVAQIEKEDGIFLEQRLKEARVSRDKFVFTLVTVSLTGFGLLGLIFYFLKWDITQRRRAEEALRQRELDFRMVVNNIPAVVFKGYLDGAVDFFDHKVEAMTGYGKADFDARRVKWTELMLKEDLRNAAKIFIRALRTDGAYVREYRLKSKEGRVIWIQERSQIVVKPGGRWNI